MYMFSFIFVIAFGLFEWKGICTGFFNRVIKGGGYIPSQNLDFQRHMSCMVFLCLFV